MPQENILGDVQTHRFKPDSTVLNFILPDNIEVRRGDYHVILRKL
jgi:hypothetical protein